MSWTFVNELRLNFSIQAKRPLRDHDGTALIHSTNATSISARKLSLMKQRLSFHPRILYKISPFPLPFLRFCKPPIHSDAVTIV
ncbi:Hypothetical protein Yxe [Bacillus subtilis subsp. subtilis str. BSP1]|nr:Hypothetical protein Yxe [Bacillus subtilis subsp. subtilis str. BSP1]